MQIVDRNVGLGVLYVASVPLVTLTGHVGVVIGTCVDWTLLTRCLRTLVVEGAVGAVAAAFGAGVGARCTACALASAVDIDC